MTKDEVVEHLNKLNILVAEFQKHLVNCLSRIQREDITDASSEQPSAASPTPAGVPNHLADATAGFTAAMDSLSSRIEQRSAGAPVTPEVQRARERLAAAADQLTTAMVGAKTGPEGVAALQAARAGKLTEEARAEMPTLKSQSVADRMNERHHPQPNPANGPVRAMVPEAAQQAAPNEPDPQLQQAMMRENLMRNIYQAGGLLARCFGPALIEYGRGPLAPTAENLFENDISTLPYDRLMEWPVGFYTNPRLGSYQYLGKTREILYVIDFGILRFNGPQAQEAIKVAFHGDNAKRYHPLTILDNNLLEKVGIDITGNLRDVIMSRQYQQ